MKHPSGDDEFTCFRVDFEESPHKRKQ